MKTKYFLMAIGCLLMQSVRSLAVVKEYDIVVYGGTSSGIVAAIQAARMEKTVVLIEPYRRIGGLTTGGLGQTDIGNKQAIGGISREFYQNIKRYYSEPANWKWQDRSEYRDGGQTKTEADEDTMWTFEPSAALTVFQDMLDREAVDLVYEKRLDRKNGVKREGRSIVEIRMESGDVFRGKMFIDATYEGDLMATAGVSYTVGRESNQDYGETLNGVQANYYHRTLRGTISTNAKNHNLEAGVDPYVVKGDPSSGLLPFIKEGGKPGLQGSGDRGVQAYCFRMTLTDHSKNRIPFKKPKGYRELDYELLFRNFEAGEDELPWINSTMPNRKTDTNNKHGFSTDFIGQNYAYPEASYEEREAIVAAHRRYQQGLMWSLANHPRVPKAIRDEISRWGTCKDEYERKDGWQQQLYIREARRMVSDYVMRQHHCEGIEVVEDSIGMAAYGMDSHMVQRYVDANGFAQNEGNVQAHVAGPYPISYRSIVPKKSESSNLLVPVCLSATHIAFGSIRMEPVFMVLGQSAAAAAAMAIDDGVAVQDVDYGRLRSRLLSDKQILSNEGPGVPVGLTSIDSLKGFIVDDVDAMLEGPWSASDAPMGINKGFLVDGSPSGEISAATFKVDLPYTGEYEVQIAYGHQSDNATNVPILIGFEGDQAAVSIDQSRAPEVEGLFTSIGRFRFDKVGSVTLSNRLANGPVTIDAVRWVLKKYDDPRERWPNDLAKWAKEDRQKGGLDGGILFMGSSSILMWDFARDFADFDTRGRGFGGSKIWELPLLYEEIVSPHRPDYVVIYTCENDLSIGRSQGEIFSDWHSLYDRFRREQPEAHIFFLSVKQSPRREYMNDKIVAFNKAFKAELANTPNVTFIDSDTPLLTNEGEFDPGMFRDGLHLNVTGYGIWAKLIKEAIAEVNR